MLNPLGYTSLDGEVTEDYTKYLVTFIFEGVVLLIVALVGLVGNLASFITIFSQKVQKTFHSLLFLLSIFDMVRKAFSIKLEINSIPKTGKHRFSPQIYLVSAITLFAIPSLSDKYASTIQKIALPVMLPVAHIGMVSNLRNLEIGWGNFTLLC